MTTHRFGTAALAVALGALTSLPLQAAEPPNILWIIVDDMSANLSSYGETAIETPHLDRLASRGVRFTNAYVTAPVCSPNRSAFITGMYQTSIGAHHHNSSQGELKIHLPPGIRPIPELFQEAGYYTAITGWPNTDRATSGKTHYNFEWDQAMYDGPDWSERRPGQPFFAQVHLPGGKHRGRSLESFRRISDRVQKLLGSRTDPSDVKLPPYYPDDPVLLADWAAYLDSVRLTDSFVGDVIERLEDEGDLEDTVVLFMTDHGISHARGKQFLYDEGMHVPLVIAGPAIAPGQVRDDLVEHIDIAALSLALAGIEIPDHMHARDILARDYQKRTAVFAARVRSPEPGRRSEAPGAIEETQEAHGRLDRAHERPWRGIRSHVRQRNDRVLRAREREPRIRGHPEPQHRPDEALGGRGQVGAQSNRPLGEVFAPVKSGPSSRQPLKILSPIRRANRGSSA